MQELIFGLIGGTALLMYGVNMMGEGIEKASGETMKKILTVLTGKVWMAFLVGIFVTAIVQSSTAVTLLTVDKEVVTVKLTKDSFNWYNREITTDEGKEKSWFIRGTKLCVCGYRSENQFVARRYKDTVFSRTIQKIVATHQNGDIDIETERGEIA